MCGVALRSRRSSKRQPLLALVALRGRPDKQEKENSAGLYNFTCESDEITLPELSVAVLSRPLGR
jgi:hypothetical protein